MARRRVGDPEIRPLVERVAWLFLEQGSVNRVQHVLASQLAEDRSEGYVYANRLHTLLSEDPAKSVNPSTLHTIDLAIERLGKDPNGEIPDSALPLKQDVLNRWPGTIVAVPGGSEVDRIRHLASEINVPPAVVSVLLDGAAKRVEQPGQGGEPASPARSEPDWSFQDTAYERCLAALESDPNRKVGLVLPTGGGKTRLAIRILLQVLEQSELENPKVIWVTHRKRLRVQASRELQRAINRGTPDLPPRAAALLGEQVEICMLADLPKLLDEHAGRVALVVVDEAHHAAAESYAPIFSHAPLRGLFLTATPNRTDLLPIGIDEIAYATTYRDLFERGVIVEPKLDELTLPGFSWDLPTRVDELADFLLTEAEDRFKKTLVIVSRIENAKQLHEALARLRPVDHILADEDIGYAYGGGSSTGQDTQDFLDEFQARPRGILVATSQLIGEGFDDPGVDTAVVTYATQSMLDLMQVAGRCMRYAPGKSTAHVIQVRDSALAYHWEQGWLYQDISDLLRPRLEKVSFESLNDLGALVEEILLDHNVSKPVQAEAQAALSTLEAGDDCALLLTGLPYTGPEDRFDRDAEWGAILVPRSERELFMRVFNAYSELHEEINDKKAFLEKYLAPERKPGSRWRRYMDMLAAMDAAAAERRREWNSFTASRPSTAEKGTTWLTYTTFSYEPALSLALEAFLADAANRQEVASAFLDEPAKWGLALKAPLPLDGTLAVLVSRDDAAWVEDERDSLRSQLTSASALESFTTIAAWRSGVGQGHPLPQFLLDRFERLLGDDGWERFALLL